MIDICCVSDMGFLARGLALHDSLDRFGDNFRMHYLCIDEDSYDKLQEVGGKIIPYRLSDLIRQDEALDKLRQEDYRYFCWSLASYFTNYLVNELNVDMTYIDADIYFHHSVTEVLNQIGTRDIGIFRHRQYALDVPNGNGWFNVGVTHFKNTDISKEYLSWWADAVLHKKYPELATCGDQKYLDVFKVLPEDKLFIDGDIGHGAPWQWQLYCFDTYEDDGCITWRGKKQKLVFSHFSQFEYSIENNTFNPSTTHHCFTPTDLYQVGGLKKIYDNYFEEIKKVHDKYLLF
jgi:hypothetical protein